MSCGSNQTTRYVTSRARILTDALQVPERQVDSAIRHSWRW